MKCVACEKVVHYKSELVVCVLCKGRYHYACVNISTQDYLNKLFELQRCWQCPSCVNVNTRRRGDDTPVRSLHQTLNPANDLSTDDLTNKSHNASLNVTIPQIVEYRPDYSEDTVDSDSILIKKIENMLDRKLEEMSDKLSIKINNMIANIRSEFMEKTDSLLQRIDIIDNSLTTVTASVLSLTNENENLKARLSGVTSAIGSDEEISRLRECVDSLRSEINDRDQEALKCELEISGLPEFPGESPVHLILTAARVKLGIELEERDVLSAARVGRRADGAREPGSAGPAPRPRLLAVRLATVQLRDRFLREARVRRRLTTADLSLPDHRPSSMYFNERLTRHNRILFARARELGQLNGWKFVWSKGGRIFARRSSAPTSNIERLRTLSDLSRVFRVESVGSTNL